MWMGVDRFCPILPNYPIDGNDANAGNRSESPTERSDPHLQPTTHERPPSPTSNVGV